MQGGHLRGLHAPFHAHRLLFAARALQLQQLAASRTGPAAQPVMRQKILRRRRPAPFCQVGRGGAQLPLHAAELARHQRGISQRAHAQGDVDPGGDQVNHRIVQQQAQRQLGIAPQGSKRRGQQAAKPDGRGQAQFAFGLVAQARQRLLGRARSGDHGRATRVVALARFGQGQAPGRTMQQGQAQRLLKLPQMLADGRRRHAQLPRRGGQRAGRHHLGKDGHAFELLHLRFY